MKKYLLIILYNIAAIIFLCLLLEFAVRLFVPEINLSGTSSNLIIDSLYNDSPGIRSNSSGFSGGVIKQSNRYHSWKYFRPANRNTSELLFLGDSVTMGIGVENDSTYSGIINNSDSVNVVNPSLIGYSSKDYLNVFNYFIMKNEFNLKFSSVVLFWTLNDIYSDYPDKNSPEYSSKSFINDIVSFLRRNSNAYHLLKNLISDRSRAYYEYDRQFYTASNPLFLKSVENIERISSVCDSLNIKFQLVLLPYEFQIRNFNREMIFQPQQILKEKLHSKNFNIIDLAPAFKNYYRKSTEFYLYGDGIHFNIKGNSVIAGYLMNFI